ncbi:hypothetical protein Tsubulata_013584 [Turnera subulata]|uniref:CCHC-type domain-containing protein n=1 Tax=Turnera subulata TaxID=218843 RepID=A0A9Q0FUD0_9ROSI|nr:hypothetical protein Tsubulata_013584 [Turnera subulata]
MVASSSFVQIEKGKGMATAPADDDVVMLDDLGSEVTEPQFFLLAKVLGSKHLNPRAFTNVSREEHFHNVPLRHCPFWVKIYDVPMSFRNARHLALIAGKLGTFCEFDERGPLGWGKYVKVRVNLYVSKPLKKEILGRNTTAQTLVFPMKYEKLPNYCYGCGLIGHLVRECDDCPDLDSDDEQEFPFGAWLRASPTKIFISQVHTAPLPLRSRSGLPPHRIPDQNQPSSSFLPCDHGEPNLTRAIRALDLESLLGALPDTNTPPATHQNPHHNIPPTMTRGPESPTLISTPLPQPPTHTTSLHTATITHSTAPPQPSTNSSPPGHIPSPFPTPPVFSSQAKITPPNPIPTRPPLASIDPNIIPRSTNSSPTDLSSAHLKPKK